VGWAAGARPENISLQSPLYSWFVPEVFVLSLAHEYNLFTGTAGPDYAMAHTADALVRMVERLLRNIRTG
jgi:hypothetical protein